MTIERCPACKDMAYDTRLRYCWSCDYEDSKDKEIPDDDLMLYDEEKFWKGKEGKEI